MPSDESSFVRKRFDPPFPGGLGKLIALFNQPEWFSINLKDYVYESLSSMSWIKIASIALVLLQSVETAWHECRESPAYVSCCEERHSRLSPASEGLGLSSGAWGIHFQGNTDGDPRHFWSRRTCPGNSSAPGSYVKKTLCRILVLVVS